MLLHWLPHVEDTEDCTWGQPLLHVMAPHQLGEQPPHSSTWRATGLGSLLAVCRQQAADHWPLCPPGQHPISSSNAATWAHLAGLVWMTLCPVLQLLLQQVLI